MGGGEIAAVAIAAGICGVIAVVGWTVVRLFGWKRRREKRELRKVRTIARLTADFEGRPKRQQEARKEQQDQ